MADNLGTLYIVATPIGNLEDITFRALRILREASLIAAEDTRVTRKLLSHFDIHTPLTSYHQHTRENKTETILARLLDGGDVALVSDAGTPAVSDPGADLVTHALERSIPVVPVPGPSALLSAVVTAGLPTGRFAFDGFAPRTKTDRREFFAELKAERRTIVLYEAPTRLLDTLKELREALGDRPVAVARELTKLFEEVHRGTLASALAHFQEKKPRGEFTIVLGGAATAPAETDEESDQRLQAALDQAGADGESSRDAIRRIALELGLPRRSVYAAFLARQGKKA
jgi:16S rRNA (cytidine1402-2'-O)-methyltransferase